MELTPTQIEAVTAVDTSFLLGPTGTGKTTALQQRLLRLLREGEPAYTLLVLVAEPEHRSGYLDAIHASGLGSYADLNIITYNQMAMEMVNLFWPLVARAAGFAQPFRPPRVLTYDLAQLLMYYVVTPMIAEGAFVDLRLRPQQILSQVLDTLNRAALNSLSLEEAQERQMNTWTGEPERLRHLQEAAEAARRFRAICLEHSLLDLSLVIEVFDTQLVQHEAFHLYFRERYRHLLVDNVEEQTPAGQNFVQSLLPLAETTAIAYDAGGGYKRFMAADPLGANQFFSRSQLVLRFEDSFVAPPQLMQLANLVENYLLRTQKPTGAVRDVVLGVVNGRYRREMIAALVPLLQQTIADGTPPSQIAIIAPYLDGALRYTLTQALKQAAVPFRLLRRRTSPREEPRVRAWLTWLALAHSGWGVAPAPYDVAEALTLSIAGLDPARAALLAQRLYDPDGPMLLESSTLPEAIAARIGPDMVSRVEELRQWLVNYSGSASIDHFLHDLFNQLLSQPRFQPEPDVAGAAVCNWLVEAATRLRRAGQPMGFQTQAEMGRAFIEGINQGLVTANPPDLGEPPDPDGILISTIYGYLLAGQPVAVQVWLEAAATGWWDIPRQPLSNAFVLAQSRSPEEPWTAEDDFAIRNQLLSRIVRGLASRCSMGVVVANSELDRRGLRQDGPLWRALQPVVAMPRVEEEA